MAWWLIPLAFAIGALLGMLGGGGAILTIPVLVYLVHQDPKAASAGSLVVVAITSTVGALTHARHGTVRWRDGAVFGALGVAGSVLGSILARGISDALLMSLFAALMAVVAGLLIRKRVAADQRARAARSSDTGPPPQPDTPQPRQGARHWATLTGTATGVGLLTGFFGVGGGFAVVPALVLALGYGMPVAVGTSLLVIVINSLVALGTRAAGSLEIDWPVILPFAVVAAVGTFAGAKLGRKVPERALSIAFIVMLLAVGAFVAVENVPALF